MERRDWSLKGLKELSYLNSLDADQRAQGLVRWVDKYLTKNTITDFDLELKDLKKLSELFYNNLVFLKDHKENTRQELLRMKKMRSFVLNS